MARLIDPQEGDGDLPIPPAARAPADEVRPAHPRSRSGSKKRRALRAGGHRQHRALAKMNMFSTPGQNPSHRMGTRCAIPNCSTGMACSALRHRCRQSAPRFRVRGGRQIQNVFAVACRPAPKPTTPSSCTWWRPWKPGTGRMAVVVRTVLFRGAAEGRIRAKLIEGEPARHGNRSARKLFYGTGIPAAILVFRKKKLDDKVLFIDASETTRTARTRTSCECRTRPHHRDRRCARQNVDKQCSNFPPRQPRRDC